MTAAPPPPEDPAVLWYREAVCEKEGHTHGPEGEEDCLFGRYLRLRSSRGKGGEAA